EEKAALRRMVDSRLGSEQNRMEAAQQRTRLRADHDAFPVRLGLRQHRPRLAKTRPRGFDIEDVKSVKRQFTRQVTAGKTAIISDQRQRTALPLIADDSCFTSRDLAREQLS